MSLGVKLLTKLSVVDGVHSPEPTLGQGLTKDFFPFREEVVIWGWGYKEEKE